MYSQRAKKGSASGVGECGCWGLPELDSCAACSAWASGLYQQHTQPAIYKDTGMWGWGCRGRRPLTLEVQVHRHFLSFQPGTWSLPRHLLPSLSVSFHPFTASRLRGRLHGMGMQGSKCIQREKLNLQCRSKTKSSELLKPSHLRPCPLRDPETGSTHLKCVHNDTGITSVTVETGDACGGSEKG